MALSFDRQSLIPSFLYSTPVTTKTLALDKVIGKPNPSFSPHPSSIASKKSFMISAPSEPGKIEMYSPQFYAACTLGGILSCGLTHMVVTPFDLVKCNMKIDPAKYKSISLGFGVLLKEQGVKGFFRGWVPTLLGYSAQGACKFGFYEFFKKKLEECSVSNTTMSPGLEDSGPPKKLIDISNGEPRYYFRSKAGMILPFKRVTNGEESRLCWHFWLENEAYWNIKAAKVQAKKNTV